MTVTEGIVIIVIMTLITVFLLVVLPIIFPTMISDNVKRHIDMAVREGNATVPTL